MSLAWIARELEKLEDSDRRRRLIDRDGAQAAEIHVGGRPLLNFGSNDYLGLADDPRLVAAAQRAMGEQGWGSGASPLISGHSRLHQEAESTLADFEGTEAALLFPSGFAANAGTIASLVGPGDVVFADRHNHASLWDGCRLSRADVRPYRHADVAHLETLLSRYSSARRRLIVTDSIFSIDGDVAPLPETADLAERYNAMLMVDEAHATGLFGKHGRGCVEEAGLEDRVNVRVGTLSKALGSIGGFVAGPQLLVDWLVNRARTLIYSTAPPAAMAAVAMAAIQIVRNEPERRRRVQQLASRLRSGLAAAGCITGQSTTQIVPVVVDESSAALALSSRLREHGVFAPAIRPPTVPDGQACLRLSVCHGHTEAMIDRVVDLVTQEITQEIPPASPA